MMSERDNKGKEAEDLAARFLKKRGLKILARNWREKRGELDLIARQGGILCVVEVRSRGKGSPYVPEASLTNQKARRISAATRALLRKRRLHHAPVRLDFLVVDRETNEIRYYPGGITGA